MIGNKDDGTRDRSKIEQLCKSELSVSSKYAEDPSKSPGEIAEALFGSHVSCADGKHNGCKLFPRTDMRPEPLDNHRQSSQ